MAVDSEYAEVNGDNVAYQMVNPEWVMEVSCLDLLSSTTRGGTINRMVLDYRNIKLEQLFLWHPELAATVTEGGPMSLGKYLRFEDAPYIPGVLDKIISEAKRDRAGFTLRRGVSASRPSGRLPHAQIRSPSRRHGGGLGKMRAGRP